MARAGMALRRGNHGNSECDDVQRSIELLDRVLSEFDDVENANQVQNIQQISGSVTTTTPQQVATTAVNAATTPDDESPSLGHQSEDDGYMSMNGRKAKFNLAFKPLTEVPMHQEDPNVVLPEPNDFPPPPEEAQRIISNLLPKVSPAHSAKRNANKPRTSPITQIASRDGRIETIPPPQRFQNDIIINGVSNVTHEKCPSTQTTQTTLVLESQPKTRHQRPYGWESSNECHPLPPPGYRFGSLPFQHGVYPLTSPTRVPPRTVPSVLERHREVRRRGSEDNLSSDMEEPGLRPLSELADDEHFSDDSLEEMLPPPPLVNKRSSVAWEVPMDNDDTYGTPGHAKVVGRRRRKSGSQSSTSSIPNRLKEFDDWPEPPPCTTEDEVTSPFSDTDDVHLPHELSNSNISGTGTYIIRRGRKDRRPQLSSSVNSSSSLNSRLSSDMSIHRYSGEMNSRLNTPNSRYSIDLGTSQSRAQELNSPKSRYSLDLNNRPLSQIELSSPSRSSSRSSTPQSKHEFKKHSTTFDNIKSLIKEGVIEHYNGPHIETTTELNAMVNPIVRVVSLPSLSAEETATRRELAVTVEEEEDSITSTSDDISPLRKIEKNISELLERRDIEVSSFMQAEAMLKMNGDAGKSLSNEKKKKIKERGDLNDLQKSNSHNEILRSEDYYRQLLIDGGNVQDHSNQSMQHPPRRAGIQKSESAKEMLISHRERERDKEARSSSVDFPRVEVLDFPPLPPSPVQEDDEYSEILSSLGAAAAKKADTLPTNAEPPAVPPHREPSNSLKTRSMDGGYSRGRRNYSSGRNERRTLPSEMESKRKYYHKRTSHSPQEEPHHMQTSCSLPETPIFARGCDIPRTPHRRAPDVPGMLSGNQTAPRQSSTMSSINTIGNMSTGGFRRGLSNSGLEQAYMGAEMMRMAGGPGRGWYPKQRQRRPASIEHLDRLAPGQNPWDASRKPLTLPPNLTPKFFNRSPRDALRRVTSLLIRKGNNPTKEGKKDKEMTSPTIHENANGPEETQKKKGFFKSLWKRSRHYSLEQQ